MVVEEFVSKSIRDDNILKSNKMKPLVHKTGLLFCWVYVRCEPEPSNPSNMLTLIG